MLLLPVVSAEDYGAYSSLDIKFNLDSKVSIKIEESNYEVEYIKSQISFFPESDERQKVLDIDLIGGMRSKIDDFAEFSWNNPSARTYEFGIESLIRTSNVFYPVKKKIRFPMTNLDASVLDYTEPTTFIDITPEIEDQARSLINSDDLFKVVYEIAEWTRTNVNYNLSTLNAEAVQKSSWVLKNKEGVCDEITNLFISLLRSIGIPARFVSGMVYSNLDNKWGNHGWAEVYFPGVGWVPYDVTFGQYAWIDPSHIKLKESKDSGSPSAEYSWRAKGVKLDLGELDTKAELVNKGDKIESIIDFNVAPLRELVGFGSFVPLEVSIKNLVDYYIVADLFVTKAPGLEGSNSKRIVLKPNEEKNAYWVLKIDDNLDPNYIYTATLGVKDNFGAYEEAAVRYSNEGRGYTKEEAEKIVESLSGREERKQSTLTGLKCNFEREYYYSNESAGLRCLVKNLAGGSKIFDVCYRADCKSVELNGGALTNIEFDVDASVGGRVVVSADSEDGIKYDYINLNVIKVPEVYIENFKPERVNYNSNAEVTFTLKSNTPVKNIVIDTGYGKLNLPDLEREIDVKYTIPARALVEGVKLTVSYEDEKGAKYVKNLAFDVEVTEIPWYVRALLWLKRVF